MDAQQLATEAVTNALPLLQGEALEHCNRWLQDPYCFASFRNELILNDFHNVEKLIEAFDYILTLCEED